MTIETLPALLYAGLCPSLLTGDLLTKRYAASYLRYQFQTLFDIQRENEYFKNKPIWLFLPEITALCSSKAKAKNQATSEIIQQLVARGGPVRIGTVYDTQNYSKIDSIVRANTQYLFVLKCNSTPDLSGSIWNTINHR